MNNFPWLMKVRKSKKGSSDQSPDFGPDFMMRSGFVAKYGPESVRISIRFPSGFGPDFVKIGLEK